MASLEELSLRWTLKVFLLIENVLVAKI